MITITSPRAISYVFNTLNSATYAEKVREYHECAFDGMYPVGVRASCALEALGYRLELYRDEDGWTWPVYHINEDKGIVLKEDMGVNLSALLPDWAHRIWDAIVEEEQALYGPEVPTWEHLDVLTGRGHSMARA